MSSSPVRRVAVVCGLLSLVIVTSATAQQAVVRSYDAPASEIGQAWLAHSAGRCLAILPWHVARETSVPSMLREDHRGLRGEAVTVVDLGDDAALALLGGSITDDCGFALGSISRSVARHLRSGGLGTLRSVNGDGTLARLPVTVIDDDGRMFLRVLPTNDRETIRKGHSGSLLIVNDQPVGMLLSVHARSGVGTVMRTDALLARVESHLRGAAPQATGGAQVEPAAVPGTAVEAPDARVSAPGPEAWQVAGWNVDALGSTHIAARLTAPGSEGYWAARVPRWPAVLELAGPSGTRSVHGVVFTVPFAQVDQRDPSHMRPNPRTAPGSLRRERVVRSRASTAGATKTMLTAAALG